ncbi:hypothetical protein EOM09_08095 [bacterium]|nr:hypothetical protein [bacterium]
MDLLKIYFIAYKNRLLNKNSNILGAYILKWINEGFISYAFKKGNLFKKSQYVIKLSSKIEFENDYEKEFYSFVKHAAFDNELTYKEFKCYTERKHFHLKNLLDEIFEKQEKQLIELGHLDKNTNTKTQVKNNSFNENDQITVTTVETSFKYNEDLIKDINDIIAFKNYIKSLNLKQDIKLSKEQLIVCELLGITNYIQSYFSTVYPEFYFRYYQYLFEIRSSSIRPETGLQKFIKLSKMEMK